MEKGGKTLARSKGESNIIRSKMISSHPVIGLLRNKGANKFLFVQKAKISYKMKLLQLWCTAFVICFFTVGCASISKQDNREEGPFHPDELYAELADSRLLNKLGVEGVILLDVEPYRVTIAEIGTTEPIGELYYTIQDGWHLKAENEVLEFIAGEGWIIAEQ
jgi:hypothetical protein